MGKRISLRRSREDGYLPPVTETRYATTFGTLFPTQIFVWEDREYVVLRSGRMARDIKTGGLRAFMLTDPVLIITRHKTP